MASKAMVQVQAAVSFVTYVAGDCVTVAANQMVMLPKDKADELAAAGYVLAAGKSAPEKKRPLVQPGRVVSDVVPDPTDVTAAEKAGTADPSSGRVGWTDPSRQAAGLDDQKDAGPGPGDAVLKPVNNDPEGEHTDPSKDGEAAKGSRTTGKDDVSKGSKPASKPVKTGQTTAHKKPRATGKGPVGQKDPDLAEPDRSTVGKREPHLDPSGPNQDEPVAEHPSPGTVAKPS